MSKFDFEILFAVSGGQLGQLLMQEKADQRVVRRCELFNGQQVCRARLFLPGCVAECREVVNPAFLTFLQFVQRLFAFNLDKFSLWSLLQTLFNSPAVVPVFIRVFVNQLLLLGQFGQSIADCFSVRIRANRELHRLGDRSKLLHDRGVFVVPAHDLPWKKARQAAG